MLNLRLVQIEATKEGIKFSCTGDIGNGAVTLRSHTNIDKPEQNVEISLSEPVALTFSLKYLVNFCKASGLSSSVKLCLSNEVPLLVEYSLASNSYLRFYLAPKVKCSNLILTLDYLLTLRDRLEMRNRRLKAETHMNGGEELNASTTKGHMEQQVFRNILRSSHMDLMRKVDLIHVRAYLHA